MRIRQLIRMENRQDMRLRWLGPRLGPLALAVAFAVGAALLVGSGGESAGQSVRAGAYTNTLSATGTRIARVDMHVETERQGKDWEVNVALTQTENDCQAPLNGGICLRYSIIVDEQAVSVGYGVIPSSDVMVVPQAITLRVDTRTTPGFSQVIGSGLSIAVKWHAGRQVTTGRIAMGQTATSLARIQPPAMAVGDVGSFVVPGAGLATDVVATMIMQ